MSAPENHANQIVKSGKREKTTEKSSFYRINSYIQLVRSCDIPRNPENINSRRRNISDARLDRKLGWNERAKYLTVDGNFDSVNVLAFDSARFG